MPGPSPSLSAIQERNLRLEAIFLPEARRQRDLLYKRSDDPRFSHYTRADAAPSIINQKRIWLRNTSAMADYLEVQHEYDLIREFFNTGTNRSTFTDVFDRYHDGAALETLNLFDGYWNNPDHSIRYRLDGYLRLWSWA
jgi:hypothetical protein